MNFGAVDMRDGAPIEFISLRTEEAIDRFNKLGRKDLGHRDSSRNEPEVQRFTRYPARPVKL